MNRLQDFLDNPRMMTGMITFAADPELTLVAADEALCAMLGGTGGQQTQDAAAKTLPGRLAGQPGEPADAPAPDSSRVPSSDAASSGAISSGTAPSGALPPGETSPDRIPGTSAPGAAPAPRPGTSTGLPKALAPLLEAGEAFRQQLAALPPHLEWKDRLICRDGTLLRISLSATLAPGVLHESGHPVYMAMIVDCASVDGMQLNAEYERLKYALIADISEDLPFEYDFRTDTMTYSPKYRAIFGQEPVIPRFLERLRAGGPVDPVSDGFRDAFLNIGASRFDISDRAPECFLPTAAGTQRWFALYGTTLHDGTGAPLKSLGALRNIDRQKREQLRLLDQSRTDSMTGLLNKLTTEQEIRSALASAHSGSLGVLFMVDIDNFKSINDNMGHLAGDSVILEVARQIRRIFRQDDIIGRVGGDEFHIYMRDVRDRSIIRSRARDLCTSIRRLFPGTPSSDAVSISVGVAVTDAPLPYEELFHKADIALYQAKDHGRNRCEFFGEGGEEPAATELATARNSILVDIIDTLFSIPDLGAGIDRALAFIGNALNVDKLIILEYSLDGTCVSITHEWCADPRWATTGSRDFPAATFCRPKGADAGGIFYCSDTALAPSGERPFLLDDTTTSLLQCDIAHASGLAGHIRFEEHGSRRIWTQQEIDALILMSKLIGESIRQRLSSSLLRRSSEDICNILNSLTSTAVYVIDSDYRIVYGNDTVTRAYPDALSRRCHEVFWQRSRPCFFCPVRRKHARIILPRRSPFPGLSEVSISPVIWNGGPAHAVQISEHLESPDERESRRKRDALARALCSGYLTVVDVNLDTERCSTISLNGTDSLCAGETGYGECAEAVLRHVAPPFRRDMQRLFSLANMRSVFPDAVQLRLEYQTSGRDGVRWLLQNAFAYTQTDGSRHMLLCTRDIDKRKRSELHRQRKEQNVEIALRNSYAKIYQIDVDTNHLTCLFSNAGLIAPIDFTGRLEEDIASVVPRVHPGDRRRFQTLFDRGNLLAGLREGRELSGEYRKIGLNGEYRWLQARVVPLPNGGTGEALILVLDISEKKEQETNYLAALQSNYSEIFQLDLATSRISPLYYDSRQVNIASSADFETFMHERSLNRVHPDNLRQVIGFYSVEAISRRIGAGEVLQIEYRKRPSEDAPYRWINVTIRPIAGSGRQAILFVRDITDLREEENNFFNILQSSYTEIYEVTPDADTVRILHRDTTLIPMPGLTLCYRADTQTIAEACIHPDDRQMFLDFYDPETVRRGLSRHPRLLAEYRMRSPKGDYLWWSSLLLPLPGLPGMPFRFLILGQEISNRQRAEEQIARLERRQSAVFRQSGDFIIEIGLRTGHYVCDVASPILPAFPSTGNYADLFPVMLSQTHPEDRGKARRILSLEALRGACPDAAGTAQPGTVTEQYRILGKNGDLWLETRVFFLEENSDSTAFFLVRDITSQKRLEQERDLEEERFNLALRNTYSEIYELDLRKDIPHLVYAAGLPLIHLDAELTDTGRAPAGIRDIADRLVHPEDRDIFLKSFDPDAIRPLLSGGHGASAEYRRLGTDGGWHWVSSSVVPLCAHDVCRQDAVMLLVRDIAEQKQEEHLRRISEQYDHALRNIYDELFELNVTQDSYRIVYHVEGKYLTPPETGTLSAGISLVAEKMIHEEDRERFLSLFDFDTVRKSFTSGREFLIGEFRKRWHDGTCHWASLTLFPVSQAPGGDEIYLVFVMDIAEKKQAEELAQQNIILERRRLDDERYRTIIEQTGTLVFEWNLATGVRFISPELPARFAGNYDGRELFDIWRDDGVIHPEDLPLFETFLSESRTLPHTEMTVRFRRRDSAYIWCRASISSLCSATGEPERRIGTLNDVDNATRSVLALRYRAEFDLLTDIWNMHTFYARTESLLREHPERRYSIIRMDIDRFKVINDLYGLKEGDKLLVFIADMLRDRLRKEALYGRLGGDIFCICLAMPRERILALIREFSEGLAAYPLPYKIVPSFGICEVDNISTPINVLCDWANLALKTIKGNYMKRYAFYDGKLREKILEEKAIENQMHEALLQGQFQLYLQPKVHIPSSRIIGAEGLVRWNHPTEGLLPPARFIPLFERNGFITRLDEYIWEQTCIAIRRWLDQGLTPVPVSVNMSRMHIHDPRLREKLTGLVQHYDIPPALLELEITESAFLENERALLRAMQTLREDGFRFSMDDFGAGYSSLNMLKSMPVDYIKIDRGFLNEVVATERGKTVIRFSIALARQMDIKVIAEGVETEQQAAFLMQAGCSVAQGYLYARALPVPDFEAIAFTSPPHFPIAPAILALNGEKNEE